MEFCFMNAKIERNHLKLRANVEKVTDGISLEKGMEWNERNEPKFWCSSLRRRSMSLTESVWKREWNEPKFWYSFKPYLIYLKHRNF